MACIIELFGIPGAGKTTFRALLAEKLKAEGIEVAKPVPPSRTEGRFPEMLPTARTTLGRVGLCMRNRQALWWCLKVLHRSPRPIRQKTAAFRVVFVTLERYDTYQRDTSDRVYIVDEGPLQRLFLLLVERDGARSEVDRRIYMNAAPFGDLLVHVQVSPQQALARLGSRERGLPPRLLGLDDDQTQLCLAQGDALLAVAAVEATAVSAPDRPVRQLTEFRSQGLARDGGGSDGT